MKNIERKEERKMKKFLNKVLNFLKRFPVVISLTIIVPSLVFLTRYLFTIEYAYHNYYYDGEELDINDSTFELTGIKKVGKVAQVSKNFSYQGGACYENDYVVCLDALESILIYDSVEMKLTHTVNTGIYDVTWHCNQIFFGPDFYKVSDKYPLLYVSMEHKDVHSTIVFRLYQKAGEYYVEQVQDIKLDFSKEEDTIYYPNSYYDYESGLLYYGGYTEETYMKSDSNKIKFYVFDLPDYREEYEILETKNAIDSFELPSETATQGGFISHGHLYQTFSFNSKTDPLRAPKMRVVDLQEKKIIKDYQNLGELFGVYEEFEHVAINRNGQMFSLGNPSNIYQFEFKAEQKSH